MKGKDGMPGNPGQNSGNFYALIKTKSIGNKKLHVILKGGKGGKGGRGGDGQDGESTIDKNFLLSSDLDDHNMNMELTGKALEKELGKNQYLSERKEYKMEDMKGYGEKTLQFLRQIGTFNDVYDSVYKSHLNKDETKIRGGDSGKPGYKGFGGKAGNIKYTGNNYSIFNVNQSDGSNGENGSLGRAGQAGAFEYFEGTYREEKIFPTVRKLFGNESVKEFDKNISNEFLNQVYIAITSNVLAFSTVMETIFLAEKIKEEKKQEKTQEIVKLITLNLARILSQANCCDIEPLILKMLAKYMLDKFNDREKKDSKSLTIMFKEQKIEEVKDLVFKFGVRVQEYYIEIYEMINDSEYNELMSTLYGNDDDYIQSFVLDVFKLISQQPIDLVDGVIQGCFESVISQLRDYLDITTRISKIINDKYPELAQRTFVNDEKAVKKLAEYIFSLLVSKTENDMQELNDNEIVSALNNLQNIELKEDSYKSDIVLNSGGKLITTSGLTCSVGTGISLGASILLKQSILQGFEQAMLQGSIRIAKDIALNAAKQLSADVAEKVLMTMTTQLIQQGGKLGMQLAKDVALEGSKILLTNSGGQIGTGLAIHSTKTLITEGGKLGAALSKDIAFGLGTQVGGEVGKTIVADVGGQLVSSGAKGLAGDLAGTAITQGTIKTIENPGVWANVKNAFGVLANVKNAFSWTSILVTVGVQTGLSLACMLKYGWVQKPEKLKITNPKFNGKVTFDYNKNGLQETDIQEDFDKSNMLCELEVMGNELLQYDIS